MKLDIGGGRKPFKDYTVVDIVHSEHVDILADAKAIPLKDCSVEVIRARHLLEHLSPADARLALKEWFRLLRPGGYADIIVPDLTYHAWQITQPGQSKFLPKHSNYTHAISSIYGWQDKGEGMDHRWGYTRESLQSVMESAGFVVKFQETRACDIYARGVRPQHRPSIT